MDKISKINIYQDIGAQKQANSEGINERIHPSLSHFLIMGSVCTLNPAGGVVWTVTYTYSCACSSMMTASSCWRSRRLSASKWCRVSSSLARCLWSSSSWLSRSRTNSSRYPWDSTYIRISMKQRACVNYRAILCGGLGEGLLSIRKNRPDP